MPWMMEREKEKERRSWINFANTDSQVLGLTSYSKGKVQTKVYVLFLS